MDISLGCFREFFGNWYPRDIYGLNSVSEQIWILGFILKMVLRVVSCGMIEIDELGRGFEGI